jgi:hypothetical protein
VKLNTGYGTNIGVGHGLLEYFKNIFSILTQAIRKHV